VLALSAQSTYGAGCAGSYGIPTIAPTAVGPRLSEPFVLDVAGLPTNALLVGIMGFSRTSWNGLSLPSSLAPLGMPGCQLLVSADLTMALADRPTPNTARWTTPVPYLPALLGVDLHQQVLVHDPAANAAGMTTSNASQATIGWD